MAVDNKPRIEKMNPYIRAVKDNESGQWRGLYFVNRPTPSGCNRFLVRLSTADDYPSEMEAIEVMRQAFAKEKLERIGIVYKQQTNG